MKLTKWQQEKLERAYNHLQELINRADDKKGACTCDIESCKNVKLFITSWVMPDIKRVMEGKR